MKAIQTLVIMLSTAIAYILFIFGIRQIKLNKVNRYNLFLSTLFLMLGFLSLSKLNYAQENNSSVSEQPKKTQQLQSSQRIAILNNAQEWKNFKVFWKMLDQIKPEKTPQGQYEWFEKELQNVISGLKRLEKEKISPLEINLLEQICIDRIGCILYGRLLPFSRAVPPHIVYTEESLLRDLEMKIDKLIELKKESIINKKEFQQALLNIQEDIKAFCTLDTIRKQYHRQLLVPELGATDPTLPIYPLDFIEAYISEFEKDYAEYLVKKKEGETSKEEEIYYKDIDQKYLETKQALEELKTALPGLNELVADLENG